MFSWNASAAWTYRYRGGAALLAVVLILAVALGLGGMRGAMAAPAASGDLDPSFGNGGKVTTQFDSNSDQINGLAVQPDGKIVAVGKAMPPCGDLLCLVKYSIARYNADGSLDASFGDAGKVVTNLLGDWSDESQAVAVAVQPDGKLLVAGTAQNPDYSRPTFSLVRYNPDGSVDTGFATNGVVLTGFDSAVGCCLTEEGAYAIALQADGKILLAGTGGTFPTRTFAVARYNSDGTLDSTFGTGGKVQTGGDSEFQARGVAVQPDGKILVSGNSGLAFAVVRYMPNGALDPGFGTGGIATATPALGGSALGMVLRPNGKIAVGGWTNLPPIICGQQLCEPKAFAVVQYNPNGSLDTSFGSEHTGMVVTYFIPGPGSVLGYAIARMADDRLVLAGYSRAANFALVTYLPDGNVDTNFGNNGLVETSFGSGIEIANAVAVQADGKVIAAGKGYPDPNNPDDGDFALARYQVGSAAPPPTAPPGPTTPPAPSATPVPGVTVTPGGGGGFSDVHPTDYFYTPVTYLASHNVISGYADGTFRPYNNTTRAQMVKIVVLGFQKPMQTPAGGNNTFADVSPSHPFFAVIETAAALNVVSGYACGGAGEPCDAASRPYFRPAANVTRGQLSKIDVVTAGWPLLNPASPTFADVAPGSAFYPFVQTAVCRGVISGYVDGTFRPGANATRGQISKIVYLSITASSSCSQ